MNAVPAVSCGGFESSRGRWTRRLRGRGPVSAPRRSLGPNESARLSPRHGATRSRSPSRPGACLETRHPPAEPGLGPNESSRLFPRQGATRSRSLLRAEPGPVQTRGSPRGMEPAIFLRNRASARVEPAPVAPTPPCRSTGGHPKRSTTSPDVPLDRLASFVPPRLECGRDVTNPLLALAEPLDLRSHSVESSPAVAE